LLETACHKKLRNGAASAPAGTGEQLAALVEEVALLRGEIRALKHAQPDRLVPIRELAARASCSVKTVYRRVNMGLLHPIQRPHGTYFTQEEADRAIREGILP
jgi:predicted DNA-binding transcriptional regulator AlpA